MLKQGLIYCQVAHQGSCCASSPGIPAASKNIFMDRCVRGPCVIHRSQMCRLRFDLRTRRNREPATLTLGIFCVRKETSCDQKQLRSRTASTWISLHAQRDMFLQNNCCGLAPPDRLMHIKLLRFRHGGTIGSQSTRKKTWISIMINKQVHAIKTAAFSPCGHTWISLRAQ